MKALAHFFVLGALLFAAKGLWPAPADTIVVSAADVARLRAEWTRETRRPPAGFELEAQIRTLADEEMLVREALRLGLDRSDPVVGGRLARNMRFVGARGDHAALVKQATALGMARSDVVARRRLVQAMQERFAAGAEVTDADVDEYLARHEQRYAGEARVSFRQRFVGPGPAPVLLAMRMSAASEASIARMFGSEFASAALQAPAGQWTPARSAYGMHEIYVVSRDAAPAPDLAAARRPAYFALLQERERQATAESLRVLRQRYPVAVEHDALALGGAP